MTTFDTSNATNMAYVFYNCTSLESIDLSSFDTSKVMNMTSMFHNCPKLQNLDVSMFDTSSVTTMYCMFSECSSLTDLDLSTFNTANVTNMGGMFAGCSGLTSLDVSNFDTAKVTSMKDMFDRCSSLPSLDIGTFDTSSATNMSNMFSRMPALRMITLGDDFSFKGAYAQTTGQVLTTLPTPATVKQAWIRLEGGEQQKGTSHQPGDFAEAYPGAAAPVGTYVWDTLVDFVFHANGATGGAMPVQTVDWEDGDAVLDALGFTWEGHSFLGWNTEPDGSGTPYADRAAFAQDYLSGLLPAEVNLYAQWKADPSPVEVAITVFKRLEGGELSAGQFAFDLIDETGAIVAEARNGAVIDPDKGLASVDFATLSYAQAGTCAYTVREQVPGDACNADGVRYDQATADQLAAGGFAKDGVVYDTSERAVTVTVAARADGTLSAEVSYDGADAPAAFENRVEEPAPVLLARTGAAGADAAGAAGVLVLGLGCAAWLHRSGRACR